MQVCRCVLLDCLKSIGTAPKNYFFLNVLGKLPINKLEACVIRLYLYDPNGSYRSGLPDAIVTDIIL